MPLPLAYNYLQNKAEEDQQDEFGNPKPQLPPPFTGAAVPPPPEPPMPIPPQFGGPSDTSQYEAETPNFPPPFKASTTPQRDRYQQMLQEGPKRSIPGTIAAALAGFGAGYLNSSGKNIRPVELDPAAMSNLTSGGYNNRLKRAQQAASVEQAAAAEELNRKKIEGETAHWNAQGELARKQAEMLGKKPVAIPGSKGAYYDPTTGTVIGDLTDSPAKQAADRAAAAKQQGKTEENTPGLGEYILTGKFPKAPAASKENPNQWIADSTNPDPAISGPAKAKLAAAQEQKPTIEKAKDKFTATMAKLSAAGELSADAYTNVGKMASAIDGSKALTPEEKSDARAYLAANTTPAATGSNTTLRVEGMGQMREMPVLDTKNGNSPMFLSAADINKANREEPGRYIPSGPGISSLNKTALLEDIRGNVQQTRNSLASIPNFDAMDKVKIAAALRNRDSRSAIASLISSGAIGALTPQQQDYLINVTNLIENAMAMRSVLGAGQGSDELRTAIMAVIPGPTTPSKDYAMKQLDVFEKTLNRLGRGIPKVPLRTDLGGTEEKPTPTAPSADFSVSYQGKIYHFPNQQAADGFKRDMKIQ